MESIAKAIEDALSERDDPPPNEASTCERVILPLLWASGYAKRDILSHATDSGGGIPDYTIFPKDDEHRFFLEAKAWSVALEDDHARQALNYANNDGKQWVVLTNGQEWRLYDNHIHGLPDERMVAVMHLEDRAEAGAFLAAIGKESVCAGKLGDYARTAIEARQERKEEEAEGQRAERVRAALVQALAVQFATPDGELVRAIHAILTKCEALHELKPGDIVAYFSKGLTVPKTDTDTGPKGFTDIVNDVLMERGAFAILSKDKRSIWFLPKSVLEIVPRNADPEAWDWGSEEPAVSVCCWMEVIDKATRVQLNLECCRTRDKKDRLRLVEALRKAGFTFGCNADDLSAKYSRFWMKQWRKRADIDPARPMDVRRLVESLLDERRDGFNLLESVCRNVFRA